MPQPFRNYEAAERRRNLIPFCLFQQDADISWIADTDPIPDVLQVSYSASIVIDAAEAQIQVITLTGDLDITSITYSGSLPALLQLVFKQDSVGGHLVTFPASVALYPSFQISLAPNTNTTLNLLSMVTARWETSAPPVIGPS